MTSPEEDTVRLSEEYVGPIPESGNKRAEQKDDDESRQGEGSRGGDEGILRAMRVRMEDTQKLLGTTMVWIQGPYIKLGTEVKVPMKGGRRMREMEGRMVVVRKKVVCWVI